MKDYVGTSAKPPSDVALAWLLQNPVVTAPLIGTVEQLQQALHATTVTLSDDTMSCLDENLARPRGSAQAYAVMTKLMNPFFVIGSSVYEQDDA